MTFSVGDTVTPLPFLLDNNEIAKGLLELGHFYTVKTACPISFTVAALRTDIDWTNNDRFWRLIMKRPTSFFLGEIE